VKSWSYHPSFSGGEYAYLYCQDEINKFCPDSSKDDWKLVNDKMKAYFKSFSNAKINLDDNCIFDMIPNKFLMTYYEVKTKIVEHILNTVAKPKDYDYLVKLSEVLWDIKNRPLNVMFDSVAPDSVPGLKVRTLTGNIAIYINFMSVKYFPLTTVAMMINCAPILTLILVGPILDEKVKDAWNNNAEFYLHTKNRLDYIKNKSPNTRITLLDTSKSILDSLLNNLNNDWVNTKNDVFNATGAFQFNPLYFIELRKRLDKLKRVAYVIGIDKPKLLIENNNLYLFFIDKTVGIVSLQENINEYSNITTVLFYWDVESCDLMCKQAHTIFKIIKNDINLKKIWQSADINIRRRLQEILLRNVIYTTWDNNWFQVNKTIQDWNCEWDYWFTQGMSDSKEYAIWLDGLKTLKPKISNFIDYDVDGSIKGTKHYLSKFYYIGSMEN
jgi:hypothetical protein